MQYLITNNSIINIKLTLRLELAIMFKYEMKLFELNVFEICMENVC